jgi:hypothetical protein
MNLRSRVPFELIVIYKFIISKKINYTSKRESDREKWQAQLIVLKDKGKQRKERFTFTLFKGENKREKGKKKIVKTFQYMGSWQETETCSKHTMFIVRNQKKSSSSTTTTKYMNSNSYYHYLSLLPPIPQQNKK